MSRPISNTFVPAVHIVLLYEYGNLRLYKPHIVLLYEYGNLRLYKPYSGLGSAGQFCNSMALRT